MTGTIILNAMMATLAVTLTRSPSVSVQGTTVHLSDIATVRGAAPKSVAGLVIARLAAGSTHRVPRGRLAALVRRALPAASVDGTAGPDISISSNARPSLPAGHCFEAAVEIAPHEPIAEASLRRINCDDERRPALVVTDPYRGAAIAEETIRSGDYLGQLAVPKAPTIGRGAKLVLVSSQGPVTIRRQIVALQPLHTGQRKLFVRAADGTVFSAPVSAEMSK